jgi:hypothetical protein
MQSFFADFGERGEEVEWYLSWQKVAILLYIFRGGACGTYQT